MTKQLELFKRQRLGDKDLADSWTPHKLARRDDPATSKAAAAQAKDLVSAHEGTILDALRGDGGALAAEEIADRTDLDAVQVARRLSAMATKGLVVRTTLVHTTRSGRSSAKWGAL